MSNNDFISSGLIEAYVLGLCTTAEKQEVEALRLQHTEINDAIFAAEIALEKQFQSNITPSLKTDEKILNTILNLNQEAPIISIAPKKQFNWRALAAAALLLFGISAVYNYILVNKNKAQLAEFELAKNNLQNKTLPAKDYAILTNNSITPVAMYGVGLHGICRCTMFWDKANSKSYLMIHHLMPLGKGKKYQLWAEVNGKIVDLGTVDERIRNQFIEINNVPENAVKFSITLEDDDNNPAPNLDEIYVRGQVS